MSRKDIFCMMPALPTALGRPGIVAKSLKSLNHLATIILPKIFLLNN
jgi:hypothetical protein